MTEVWYCTRDDVKSALDVAETARSNAQIDREIEGASRSIEGDLLRYFYPSVSTQTFDWPDHQFSAPWRLWLDQRELTAITQVMSAGVDITASVMLRPDDAPLRGMPFTKLEIDLSTSAAFNAGSTFQRSISVTGTFGYCADETPGGALGAAITDTTGTAVTVTNAALVGVGSILRVDTERVIVTERAMVTTGQTQQGSGVSTANTADVTLAVGDGTKYAASEVVQLDAEQMLITSIVGNNLTVQRAWNGTVLAGHTGATIYAARQLTVARGALGTTAATHSNAAAVNVHKVPSLVRDLCVAETLNTLVQERRGYTQIVKRSGSGQGGSPGDPLEVSTALDDLRRRARARYARMRTRTAARLV